MRNLQDVERNLELLKANPEVVIPEVLIREAGIPDEVILEGVYPRNITRIYSR